MTQPPMLPGISPAAAPAPAPPTKPKLEKFTRKKKQTAFDELNALMAEGYEFGPGLEYVYDWLHAELQKKK